MEIKIVNLDGTSGPASEIGGVPTNKELRALAKSESLSNDCHALIGSGLDSETPSERVLNVSACQGVEVFVNIS